MTGQAVSMGRWATVLTGNATAVLLTERPAPTFDPACFPSAGIDISALDIISVRSPNMFRAGYGDRVTSAFILDLPGASTPNLTSLEFIHGGRGNFPFQPGTDPDLPIPETA